RSGSRVNWLRNSNARRCDDNPLIVTPKHRRVGRRRNVSSRREQTTLPRAGRSTSGPLRPYIFLIFFTFGLMILSPVTTGGRQAPHAPLRFSTSLQITCNSRRRFSTSDPVNSACRSHG